MKQDSLKNVSIDKEEHGQVDLLASEDLLLFKAEALHLGKVGSDLQRCGPGKWSGGDVSASVREEVIESEQKQVPFPGSPGESTEWIETELVSDI